MHRIIATIVIAIGAIGINRAPASVATTVAFDSLGITNSYSNSGVWFGTRPQFPATPAVEASSFRPSSSGYVERLTTSMTQSSPLDQLKLYLRTDQSGRPGATIWEQTFNDKLGSYGSVAIFDNLNGPWLNTGDKYWLVATVTDGQTYQNWWSALTGQNPTAHTTFDGGPWTVYSSVTGHGMRVEVIPEPGCGLLAASGLMLAARRRR